MHLESRIVQQCQQIVNALSYFCNFQQCCDDVLGVCRRPCFVEILQDSDNKWFHNIPNLCGICLELIQWLDSTCKYMININLLTHFESSSHGFTLYIVIQCWNERIPCRIPFGPIWWLPTHSCSGDPDRPHMSLRQRGKSEATKARFGLPVQPCNFQISQKL